MKIIYIGLLTAFTLVSVTAPSQPIQVEVPVEKPVAQFEKVEVIEVLPEVEILEPKIETPTLNANLTRICSCESNGVPNKKPRHFDADGNVLRGKINNLDIGMCQINLHYHGARADKLGIDLFTEAGNIEYANMLYVEQGTQPWSWSKSCWE